MKDEEQYIVQGAQYAVFSSYGEAEGKAMQLAKEDDGNHYIAKIIAIAKPVRTMTVRVERV